MRAVASAGAAITIAAFSLADLEQAAFGDVLQVRRWIDALRDAGLHLIDEAPVDVLGQPSRAPGSCRRRRRSHRTGDRPCGSV